MCGARLEGKRAEPLGREHAQDNGGTGSSFSPTDLVATALGSCMMTIMAIAAERMSIDL